LERLYRTANHHQVPGTDLGKFVYLDMEEYRDLYLTSDVLMETLSRPGLENTRAGIALQAYIPDSYQVMQTLIAWSKRRVANGANPITIRLVKGANMEMERVESSISGHPQAPFTTKVETDANYKKMLRELFAAASEGIVRIGLASHNLFDVALGMTWCENKKLAERVQIEMLEGMANHQRRAISERFDSMLLYAPACRREDFINAIGYLIRRLDENTGQQNFLRHAFKLKSNSDEFRRLADDFRKSVDLVPAIDNRPRRNQCRRDAPVQPAVSPSWQEFQNEPDTDWAVPGNSVWVQEILDRWKAKGEILIDDQDTCDQVTDDPSRPGVVVCRYRHRTIDEVRDAVRVADEDPSGWREKSADQIHQVLRDVAQHLRVRRGDLIGVMVAEGGKTVLEADPEISEAIDFCEFYPLTAIEWKKRSSLSIIPRGVVAVITPWNFPLAIPCGGIAAALSMGNRVLLKPSSETVLIAKMLCDAFWDAGVPRDVLQFLPCDESVAQSGLVANELVDTVVLTGATSTAKKMLTVRPGLHLLAETGGKNATIVTAMADRELAIKHVLHSAFGHAGQKCSATSLLLLEDEVFNDQAFKRTLADAVQSLEVGSAWDLHTKMGPLIAPPGDTLTRGLKTLEDDESWLVTPEHIDGNPNLYGPGVKWNIKPGGFAHMNEMFGPVLGVMRFSRLEEAIAIVQRTGYGLTSGLESLDDREIQIWKESIPAGNLYINRPTTGAIVLRQPFGGVGLSAYGPGVKAGGPHYVLALAKISHGLAPALLDASPSHPLLDSLDNWFDESSLDVAVKERLSRVSQSARLACREEFEAEHDTLRLLGQDNLRRYRPLASVTIRMDRLDQFADVLVAVLSSVAAMTPVTLSMDPAMGHLDSTIAISETLESIADALPRYVHPLLESDQELSERIRRGAIDRLRLLRRLDQDSPIAVAATDSFVTIISEPVIDDARVEILRYLNEQSISYDYHRYGNLGRRADEERRSAS
jgi:RHH-type proline utilization regulon transcriptional repressor/proline dehydrogenase/delta 1-pyrroline-5-carboxylate dehydrogenase